MISEIKACDDYTVDTSERNRLNDVLFQAATRWGYQNPGTLTVNDIVLCDRERLGKIKTRPDGLWYHWCSISEKGSAKLRRFGQEIEIGWWTDKETNAVTIDVRVHNPTFETYESIPVADRERMRVTSRRNDEWRR